MDDTLSNRTFAVTGATSGIGLAVADALLKRGGSVIGTGRTGARCQAALDRLREQHGASARVAFLAADLSLQREVRGLAEDIRTVIGDWGSSSLDALINNAATVPFWQTLTPEGLDTQWAVNHLAPFLLTMELLPQLRAASAGRVVIVTSGSHYGARLDWGDIQLLRHYSPLRAYGQTKLANVLFATEFNRRISGASQMRAFAADPGLVKTEIGFKSKSVLAKVAWGVRRQGGIPPEKAAKWIVFLAVEPSIQTSPEVYWKDGKPKTPSAYARNPQAARQLWELSSLMCGLRP
jgi:NAD(P)-dependent dehydrogenase (short-subunit alcohol dehydrogenase family)